MTDFVDVNFDFLDESTELVAAIWAPVLLRPVLASPECLVVGCVAVSKDGFHVEMANEIRRLNCLYGVNSRPAVFAIDMARNHLVEQLSLFGAAALENLSFPLSSIEIGAISEAEGTSLKHIAQGWISSLSSLHDNDHAFFALVPLDEYAEPFEMRARRSTIQMGVFDHVTKINSHLIAFFGEHIRSPRSTKGTSSFKLNDIDFSGNRLVANFARLSPNPRNTKAGLSNIKQRLWDLNSARNQSARNIEAVEHSLIVQLLESELENVSDKHAKRLEDSLEGLHEAAIADHLELRRFSTEEQIAEHVVATEAA